MSGIPYSLRILFFATLIVVLLGYERRKHPGSRDKLWEYGGLIVAGLIGAVYGVMNDAVTFSISPEYFIYGKQLDPGSGLRLRALLLGAQAGFSAGAIACAIWHFIFRKQPVKERCFRLLKRCWIPFVCAVVFSYILPFVAGGYDPFGYELLLGPVISGSSLSCFLKVWWIHVGAYSGLLFGFVLATGWLQNGIVKLVKKIRISKRVLKWICCLLGVSLLIVSIPYIPVSIEGNWKRSCARNYSNSHVFTRFEDGKILQVYDKKGNPEWIGNYESLGWGRYNLFLFGETNAVSFVSLIWHVNKSNRLGITGRDTNRQSCMEILQQADKQWLDRIDDFSLLVVSLDGDNLYYYNGEHKRLDDVKRILTCLHLGYEHLYAKIHVFAEDAALPEELVNELERCQLGYAQKLNQVWVDDVDGSYISFEKTEDGQYKYRIDGCHGDAEYQMRMIRSRSKRCRRRPTRRLGRSDSLRQPITVFSGGESLPCELRDALDDSGLEYKVIDHHPWLKVLNLNRHSIIVRGKKNNHSFYYNGINHDFSEVLNQLCSIRKTREYFKTRPFVVYAQNKIIPDELQAVLDAVGIKYQVKDNEILRRKKIQ